MRIVFLKKWVSPKNKVFAVDLVCNVSNALGEDLIAEKVAEKTKWATSDYKDWHKIEANLQKIRDRQEEVDAPPKPPAKEKKGGKKNG